MPAQRECNIFFYYFAKKVQNLSALLFLRIPGRKYVSLSRLRFARTLRPSFTHMRGIVFSLAILSILMPSCTQRQAAGDSYWAERADIASAAILAARLYGELKREEDLQWARRIYAWEKEQLFQNSFLCFFRKMDESISRKKRIFVD